MHAGCYSLNNLLNGMAPVVVVSEEADERLDAGVDKGAGFAAADVFR